MAIERCDLEAFRACPKADPPFATRPIYPRVPFEVQVLTDAVANYPSNCRYGVAEQTPKVVLGFDEPRHGNRSAADMVRT